MVGVREFVEVGHGVKRVVTDLREEGERVREVDRVRVGERDCVGEREKEGEWVLDEERETLEEVEAERLERGEPLGDRVEDKLPHVVEEAEEQRVLERVAEGEREWEGDAE